MGKVGGVAIGAGLAAGVAGKGLFDLGATFDEQFDKIRVATGKTGAELDGLEADFKDVLKTVPADFGEVGTAIAGLGSRLGLTGKPLQKLARQMVQLSRITKTDVGENVESLTRLFGDWSISTERQSGTLDKLFRIQQRTGLAVSKNARLLVQFGAPLRQLGFDFDEAAVMFGKFEKEGVNLQTILPGFRFGLKNLSKPTGEAAEALKKLGISAKDPKVALQELFAAIKAAPSDLEATGIASAVFGRRAGSDMAAAVREGRFEYDDLIKSIKGGGDTIDKAERNTRDFAEQWQLLKNRIFVGLEPLANKVFDTIGDGMEKLATADFGKISADLKLGEIDFSGLEESAGNIKSIIRSLQPVFEFIGDVAKRQLGGLAQVFQGAAQTIKGATQIISGILTLDFRKSWEGVKNIFGGGIKTSLGLLRTMTAPVREIAARAGAGIASAFRSAWRSVRNVFSDGVSGALRALRGMVGDAGRLGERAGRAIASGFRSALGGIRAVAGDIVGIIRRIPGRLGDIGAGILRAIKGGLSGATIIPRIKVPVPFAPDPTIGPIKIPSFAEGGRVRESLALVGEEGPELAKLGAKTTLIGQEGPEVLSLPVGTRVYSHPETKRKLAPIVQKVSRVLDGKSLPGVEAAKQSVGRLSSGPLGGRSGPRITEKALKTLKGAVVNRLDQTVVEGDSRSERQSLARGGLIRSLVQSFTEGDRREGLTQRFARGGAASPGTRMGDGSAAISGSARGGMGRALRAFVKGGVVGARTEREIVSSVRERLGPERFKSLEVSRLIERAGAERVERFVSRHGPERFTQLLEREGAQRVSEKIKRERVVDRKRLVQRFAKGGIVTSRSDRKLFERSFTKGGSRKVFQSFIKGGDAQIIKAPDGRFVVVQGDQVLSVRDTLKEARTDSGTKVVERTVKDRTLRSLVRGTVGKPSGVKERPRSKASPLVALSGRAPKLGVGIIKKAKALGIPAAFAKGGIVRGPTAPRDVKVIKAPDGRFVLVGEDRSGPKVLSVRDSLKAVRTDAGGPAKVVKHEAVRDRTIRSLISETIREPSGVKQPLSRGTKLAKTSRRDKALILPAARGTRKALGGRVLKQARALGIPGFAKGGIVRSSRRDSKTVERELRDRLGTERFERLGVKSLIEKVGPEKTERFVERLGPKRFSRLVERQGVDRISREVGRTTASNTSREVGGRLTERVQSLVKDRVSEGVRSLTENTRDKESVSSRLREVLPPVTIGGERGPAGLAAPFAAPSPQIIKTDGKYVTVAQKAGEPVAVSVASSPIQVSAGAAPPQVIDIKDVRDRKVRVVVERAAAVGADSNAPGRRIARTSQLAGVSVTPAEVSGITRKWGVNRAIASIGAAVKDKFPAMNIISGVRLGAKTKSGSRSNHAIRAALDLGTGRSFGLNRRIGSWVRSNFPNSLRGVSEGVLDIDHDPNPPDHADHVHVAALGDKAIAKVMEAGADGTGADKKKTRRITGGTLSLGQMVTLAKSVKFPDPALAAAVGFAESRGKVGAIGDGGDSLGLWQINTPAHPKYDPNKLQHDALYNARAALAISRKGKNWKPWTQYRTGAYKPFLGEKGKPLPKGTTRGTPAGSKYADFLTMKLIDAEGVEADPKDKIRWINRALRYYRRIRRRNLRVGNWQRAGDAKQKINELVAEKKGDREEAEDPELFDIGGLTEIGTGPNAFKIGPLSRTIDEIDLEKARAALTIPADTDDSPGGLAASLQDDIAAATRLTGIWEGLNTLVTGFRMPGRPLVGAFDPTPKQTRQLNKTKSQEERITLLRRFVDEATRGPWIEGTIKQKIDAAEKLGTAREELRNLKAEISKTPEVEEAEAATGSDAKGEIRSFLASLGDLFKNFAPNFKPLQNFAGGGVIQGPKGKPITIEGHGGEVVFDPSTKTLIVKVASDTDKPQQKVVNIDARHTFAQVPKDEHLWSRNIKHELESAI